MARTTRDGAPSPASSPYRSTTLDQSVAEKLKGTLLRQLPRRFKKEVPADIVATVNRGTLRELETWMDLVVSADTMDQVFDSKINGHNGRSGPRPEK